MSDEPQNNKKKFELSPALAILISGFVIAGTIVFLHVMPVGTVADADAGALPANVNVPAPNSGDHIVGSLSAPITLVEYSDFQCPYCRLVYPTLKQLVEESNGQVAWVHRNFPLDSIHPQAMPAALAAECIAEQLGQSGFWKFADAIFADQSKMSPAYYAQLAVQFGADEATYNSCVSTQKYASKISQEATDAQVNGGRGTPFTVVVSKNAQVPISGALPYEQFKSVIQTLQARQ